MQTEQLNGLVVQVMHPGMRFWQFVQADPHEQIPPDKVYPVIQDKHVVSEEQVLQGDVQAMQVDVFRKYPVIHVLQLILNLKAVQAPQFGNTTEHVPQVLLAMLKNREGLEHRHNLVPALLTSVVPEKHEVQVIESLHVAHANGHTVHLAIEEL